MVAAEEWTRWPLKNTNLERTDMKKSLKFKKIEKFSFKATWAKV